MKRSFFLDVVVAEGAAIFELLPGEYQALLVRRNALLVLNLGLYVVNRVTRLNVEGDRLSGEGFDKDLHLCFFRCDFFFHVVSKACTIFSKGWMQSNRSSMQ